MNIFRFVYLTCTFVYIVNNIIGAPIPQHGPTKPNPSHRFRSPDGESPVAMGPQSHNDQVQNDRGHVTPEQPGISISKLLEQLEKNMKNSQPQHPPNSRPILVTSRIEILNNPKINNEDMSLKVYVKVTQSWSDQRFRLNLPRTVQLSQEYHHLMWNPKTIVRKAFYIQDQSILPQRQIVIDTSNGKIVQTLLLTTQTSCQLDLTNYPYDWQQCVLQFGSAVYNSASVEYRWGSSLSGTEGSNAVAFSPEALAPNSEFKYEGYRANNDSIVGFGSNAENFSDLQVTFFLSRRSIFPFYGFILPFSCLVFLGSLPPFFGPEALIGRITIGATTFIGSLGLLYWRPMGPTVVLPYLSALDVYAGLSMMLTFASLVESCIVGSIISKSQGNGDKGRGQERLGSEVDTVVHFNPPLSVRLPGQGRMKLSAISRQERNYLPEFEEVMRTEDKEARMYTARRIDSVTKIVYAIAALGSILVIHFSYKTTKGALEGLKGVNTL